MSEPITRYTFGVLVTDENGNSCQDPIGVQSLIGQWVKYEDHERIVAELAEMTKDRDYFMGLVDEVTAHRNRLLEQANEYVG